MEKKETYEGEYIDGKYSSGIIFTADGKKIRVENNIRVGHKTDELKTSETETSTEKTIEEKLNELKNLYEKDSIDETEFKSKKEELIDQMKSCVQWSKTLDYLISKGCNTFIEIGPGQILTNFLKRISSEYKLINISDYDSANKLIK